MKAALSYQKKFRIVLTAGVFALTTACASKGTRSGVFGDSKSSYQLPAYQEMTLANGLRVLFVPDEKLPYVSYSLLVKAGSTQDPAGQGGLTSLVAELLDKGTAKRSAPQIATDLGNMGAEFDASAFYDSTILRLSGLSIHAEPLLANFLELVTQPSFSDAEVERVRRQMIAQIERRVDNADGFADLAYASYLYGEHPYGRPVFGSAPSVKAIKKRNIIQQYLRYYRPNNAILAVVGKFTPEMAAQIETAFATWNKRDVTFPEVAPAPAVEGRQYRIADKPGITQAQIRMGHLGIKRQDPDFIPLRVATTILGGAFHSRLNNRVRKELGLTYNISSSFDARLDRGPLEISTFTKNESVGKAIQESLAVVSAFRENGVTQEELERAKGYLKGVFPTAIETPEKLAQQLLLLRLYGVPDSYLTTYLREVDRMSLSSVNEVIKKHFNDKNMKVLVYSSAPAVLEQVKAVAGGAQVEVKKAAQAL